MGGGPRRSGEGWLVVDGFDHSAIASGATLDEAYSAWEAEVRRKCPQPPVEPPPSPELLEAMEEAQRQRDEGPPKRDPDDAPKVEKKGKLTKISSSFGIVFVPPRLMDWPAARAENVPAVALPLPARPRAPDRLQVMGFTRTVRLFGDYGDVAHGFVRRDPKGLTFIGEEAAKHVNPATFDEDLRAADAAARREAKEVWGDTQDRYARHPEYRVRTMHYTVAVARDGTARLSSTGVSHGAAFVANGLDDGAKRSIFRMDQP